MSRGSSSLRGLQSVPPPYATTVSPPHVKVMLGGLGVILIHVTGCCGGIVLEQGQGSVLTVKPGNSFWPPSQSCSTQSNVKVGRQFGVPPPPSTAWAARDRIIG